MRTQLLHVVPAIGAETDSDYDNAANDEPAEAATIASRADLSLTAAPDALPIPFVEKRNVAESNDDYWLGGYAGI